MPEKWACPKCKGHDPIHVPGWKGGHGGVPTTRLILGNLHPSRVICGACGFVEEYFEPREHLAALRKKYGAK